MAVTQSALAHQMARQVMRATPPDAHIKRMWVWSEHGHIDPERDYVHIWVLAKPVDRQAEVALEIAVNDLADLYPEVNIGAGFLADEMPGGTGPLDWIHPEAEEIDLGH